MSSNVAWLSRAVSSFELKSYDIVISFPEVIDAPEDFILQKKISKNIDREKNIEISQKIGRRWSQLKTYWLSGNYIFPELMPTKMYREPSGEIPNSDEFAFVTVGAFLVFNQVCYDVLSKARLGRTHFSQVHLYDIVTQELLTEEPFYFMNYAEQRDYLNIEQSDSIEKNSRYPTPPTYTVNFPTHGDIKLFSEANNCDVDIWHDINLEKSLFFSDKLVNDLLKAGISEEALSLRSCDII